MSTDLPRFDRPIFFENDDSEYPYSIGGSAFVVSKGRCYKVVTAKHCRLNRQVEDILVPIFCNDEHVSREFLPINRVYSYSSPDNEDSLYFTDIMVMDVDLTKLETGLNELLSVPFDETWRNPLVPRDEDTLIVRGHLTGLREVDYERRVIKEQAVLATGRYGSDRLGEHMRFMKFDNIEAISSVDGMSGSAVFRNCNNQFEFAGMIVRGSTTAGGCHFIERSVIYTAIKLACQNRAASS
jgi:hypothetical protein